MIRHTYGQTYTRDQLQHAVAVRAARDAGRAFHWVPQTAPHTDPAEYRARGYTMPGWAAATHLRYLPGDLVWTARTGWTGGQ